MTFNVDAISELTAKSYHLKILEAFGAEGIDALNELIDGVKLIYKNFPPEQIRQQFICLRRVGNSAGANILNGLGVVSSRLEAREISEQLLRKTADKICVVEVLDNYSFRYSCVDELPDFENFQDVAVMYRHDSEREHIHGRQFAVEVPRVSPVLSSNFAEPTLSGLDNALKQYRSVAGEKGCPKLKEVWERGWDGPRLVLVNRPENIMRDSLKHHLSTLLGSTASVKPEQNTDETKPVDIRIEWFGSDASALIEIKWIGRSTARARTPGGADFTDYDEGRAKSGARQLSDYLDREQKHSRTLKPMGYLVVFDARRRNVGGPDDRLSRDDALHFENAEIKFDPDFAALRDDFTPPVRFFMRPRQANFSEFA